MITQNKQTLTLATSLATLAGFIDALGFIKLGGYFVSFMSGNSTRFAVAASHLEPAAFIPFGIIILFVLGVTSGATVRHYSRKSDQTVIMAFVTLLLVFSAISYSFDLDAFAIMFMILAMGAENNVFIKDGQVSVGVTYMTGTLVKLGQRIAARLLGEEGSDWLPYLILWLGLISGAVLGSFSYFLMGLHSLWLAASFSTAILILYKALYR